MKAWLVLFLVLASATVAAQDTPPVVVNPSAEFQRGLALYRRGEQEQAFAAFERVRDVYRMIAELSAQDLIAIANATRYLGLTDPQLYKLAVRLYDEAIAKDQQSIEARVALAELLLEKYNNAEALEVLREALAIDAEHPGVLLGLARSQHFDFAPEALETVQRALAKDSHYVPARVFLAQLYSELEQYPDAEREAKQALADDPASLEALAVLAAVYHLSGDEAGFQDAERRALAINPRTAELYNTVAELAVQNRLYDDAVRFAAQAVALDGRSWRGYGLLGINQMRIGLIDQGRANLERAFAGDPYNVWLKNTLDLADTFGDYEIIDHGRFQFFIQRDEVGAIDPYLAPLAAESFEHYAERYGYQPPTPIRVELYPRHADFSVRTAGLAGIGILGVSFGKVLAMDSPSAREIGHSNWGSTFRHELAHAFHLGMTDHRVPRWFSEGLAVHEERRARPGWGSDVTPDFLIAYRNGKLLPVSQLNNGFVRPSYPQQIIHSYYQASLVLEFIETRWGFAAVRKMLDGFKARQSSAAAIEAGTGLDSAAFDHAFDDYLKTRFAGPLAALALTAEAPDSPPALIARAEQEPGAFVLQLQAGHALLEQGELDQAETFLKRAEALFPDYAGDDSPYWFLAELYAKRDAPAQAAEQLEKMIAINADHYQAHVKLAELRRALGDKRGAAEALDRAIYIYPFALALHQQLADLYGEINDWPLAVRERRTALALKPVDLAEARYQLANAYFQGGNTGAARREVLAALELAPNFERAQDLLLRIRAQTITKPGELGEQRKP